MADPKVEVTESASCERTLTVTVEPETVRKERERVIADFRKKARIEGFRPGKAPRKLIEGRFADAIKAEYLQKVLNDSCIQALEQESIRPLSRPEVQKVDLAEDDTLNFVATVEVPPEIELQSYTGLTVDKPVHEITDEDVQSMLDSIREQQARFTPKEGAAEKGDYLLLDFTVLNDDGSPQEESTRDNQLVMAGHEDETALFSHKLVGLKEGEDQRIEVDFPEDFPDESLKGRSVGYKVDVKGVRTKSLPEPDDEFARSVSPDDDMEGLKLKLRQELEADVAQRANRVVEELLFRQIIEVNPFEVPSSMVEMVIGQRLKNASQQYPNQDFDQDEFAQAARPSAEYGVKREYVIQEIIKKEQLEVEQAEIEAKIEEFAGQVGKSIDEIRKDFRSPEAAGRLGSLILEEKTVKFLMENNDIQEVEE